VVNGTAQVLRDSGRVSGEESPGKCEYIVQMAKSRREGPSVKKN